MKCYICNDEILQYDKLNNELKIPIKMGFYEQTEYEYIPICNSCKRAVETSKDKFTYNYSRILKSKYKFFSHIKELKNK